MHTGGTGTETDETTRGKCAESRRDSPPKTLNVRCVRCVRHDRVPKLNWVDWFEGGVVGGAAAAAPTGAVV